MRRYSRPSGVASLCANGTTSASTSARRSSSLPVRGELRQQLGALVLDRAVVALGDRDQQTVAPAEVVVERRRVPLPGGLDDALQWHLVDPVAGEHLLRGAQQRLPRVGRVTCHRAASVAWTETWIRS